MSQAIESTTESPTSPIRPGSTEGRAKSSPASLIAWGLGATLLLLASGLFRSIQASRYEEDKSYVVGCPFPLKTLPHSFGDWKIVEGSEVVLDPLTVRISGSTDHVLWTFVDDLTGVKVSMLLLHGPAEPVLPHTPQVCYPATGFAPMGSTVDKQIKIDGHAPVVFRTAVYAKPGGRTLNRTAVYHSYLYNRTWTPSISLRNLPRRSPGIYKVQIQRSVTDTEKQSEDDPIEQFIQKVVPVLEKMDAEATRKQAPPLAQR